MNIKSVVIGIAIMILTISVVIYGVNTFYSAPEYRDFCTDNSRQLSKDVPCPEVCVGLYEIEDGACVFNECGSGCGADGISTFDELHQCEIVLAGDNCYDLYDSSREVYSRNVFLVAIPLGIILIAIGASLFGLEAVGAGLMAGGVGVILWGVGGFWSFAQNWIKFLLSLVGLVILIWFAHWFDKNYGKKRK